MNQTSSFKTLVLLIALLLSAPEMPASEAAAKAIRAAGYSGGLVAQIGSDDLALKELGERFHVRLLLSDAKAVDKAQSAIDRAGLQGRFTASIWDGQSLPFTDRVLNALVVAGTAEVPEAEAKRVVAPDGLLVSPSGTRAMPWPESIDSWTHYLYDGSGNAVSKDREVGPPRSFRWWSEPRQSRSHNYPVSMQNLVTDRGRIFYMNDDSTPLFDEGGTTPDWNLYARDAFNGALLWSRPLEGFGLEQFEDVVGQAVPDYIWRNPLSLNRRIVADGEVLYATLAYRGHTLSILDAASGKTLREIDAGGIVDEIVAEDGVIVCRVRSEIPMPDDEFKRANAWQFRKEAEEEGKHPRQIRQTRVLDILKNQSFERVMAFAADGKRLWSYDAPQVGAQSLAIKDGRVLFHNYQALVCLDAKNGKPLWTYDNPADDRNALFLRNLLGHLLIVDGKVLWASSLSGGTVCLNLEDGSEVWSQARRGISGGFGAPTAFRVVKGAIYRDTTRIPPIRIADGSSGSWPDVTSITKRDHHVRCYMGKATERYLILPHRGTEFVDLEGDDHMAPDWIRGNCSYGVMPANGLMFITPGPCSCYAGSIIYGLYTTVSELPVGLDQAPPLSAPSRLVKGPAFDPKAPSDETTKDDWPQFRADAKRTARAASPLSATLKTGWTIRLGDDLTPATMAGGFAYIVDKSTYTLHRLALADGKTSWSRSFPAALDGPPTIVGDWLFIGCRNGEVFSLRAGDGEIAWRFAAAPLARLTLSGDRLESLWPVSSSVLYHQGLIYAVAGRSSFFDGGLRLVALDPATGAVRHHSTFDGPWPTVEEMTQGLVIWKEAQPQRFGKINSDLLKQIQEQYASGYNVYGGVEDLLTTDGEHLYLTQNKFTPELERIPLKRIISAGQTPMGGQHMIANLGFLDDSMFHRSFMMYDRSWPGYSGGSGFAARAGTMVAVGKERAYAAKHFEKGWYPNHEPGSGNRLVADSFDHDNMTGSLAKMEGKLEQGFGYPNNADFVRTGAALWENKTPLIVRAMIAAPDPSAGSGQAGGELVISGGIVEGTSQAEWDKSTRFIGPGKLQIHNGANGELIKEYDLPACPIFNGISAANGKLVIALVDGQVVCYDGKLE